MLMELENSIITAVSTLLAVGITLYFTNKRERSRFVQDLSLKEFSDLKTFYINLLSSIDKTVRYIRCGEDYKELYHEISINSAHANLIAPDLINGKIVEVSDIIYEWSSLYRQGLASKIGDTGLGFVSNRNFEFMDKANEIYPKLQEEMRNLVSLIKDELDTRRKMLNK